MFVRVSKLALTLCLLGLGPLIAQDCSVPDTRLSTSSGAAFNLTATGFSLSDLETGIDYWSGCSGYGTDIPLLQMGGSGGVPISVTSVTGRSTGGGGGCGESRIDNSSGRITGGTITVWTQQADGTSCAPLTDVIAHELGHFLGLTDVENTGCIGHIMGHRNVGDTRSVQGDDCEVADAMWQVPGEVERTSPSPITPTPTPTGGGASPLVLDLDRNGFRLSDAGSGVWFDLNADGVAEGIAWTEEGSGDGFLVLDRDADGSITSGAELFGDRTTQMPSPSPNGFLALAIFDAAWAGGNADGEISSADEIFPRLAIWMDASHDGVSQEAELQDLDSLGVTSISLRYIESARRDRYGNHLRYKGSARVQGQAVQVTDVFFLRE